MDAEGVDAEGVDAEGAGAEGAGADLNLSRIHPEQPYHIITKLT